MAAGSQKKPKDIRRRQSRLQAGGGFFADTLKIIIVFLCIVSLYLIHNIDNAWNIIKNQRDLCKYGITVDMEDCNLVVCFIPDKLYLFSIIILISIINTIIILELLFS